MQSSHSPIIQFPFSIKSLIKTSTQRVGSWCCKGREDVQMLRYCIWRGGAPNPQPKDTQMYSYLSLRSNCTVNETHLNTTVCSIWSRSQDAKYSLCTCLLTKYILDCSKGPGSFNRPEAGGRGIPIPEFLPSSKQFS